jgi:ABC-type nickel/cobalt efflux system permease component RcnA
MNELSWKQIGWAITRKLVYYAVVIFLLCLLSSFAFSLMTMANTLAFAAGLILLMLSVGAGITLAVREVLYYCSKF